LEDEKGPLKAMQQNLGLRGGPTHWSRPDEKTRRPWPPACADVPRAK